MTTTRVSLAELLTAGIRLRPAEAVAIVSEICRQYATGDLHGIPSASVIRITRDGTIAAEGPVTTGQATIARAARLLNELLPDHGAQPHYRASGGLRLVVARALRTLDLPPYASLDEFRDGLARFCAADVSMVARSLFQAWERRRGAADSPPLTISDVRRARRATGLSLEDVATAAGVPVPRLRELEWGYLRNWRADADARASLMRYARAAGLDEDLVVSITWPLMTLPAEPDMAPGVVAIPDLTPGEVTAIVQAPRTSGALTITVPPSPVRRRVSAWMLGAASVALLVFATMSTARDTPAAPEMVQTSPAPVVVAGGPAVPTEATPAPAEAAPMDVRLRENAPAPHRPAQRKAAGRQGHPEGKVQSFLHRELFRIVIK